MKFLIFFLSPLYYTYGEQKIVPYDNFAKWKLCLVKFSHSNPRNITKWNEHIHNHNMLIIFIESCDRICIVDYDNIIVVLSLLYPFYITCKKISSSSRYKLCPLECFKVWDLMEDFYFYYFHSLFHFPYLLCARVLACRGKGWSGFFAGKNNFTEIERIDAEVKASTIM